VEHLCLRPGFEKIKRLKFQFRKNKYGRRRPRLRGPTDCCGLASTFHNRPAWRTIEQIVSGEVTYAA
jgi:hypothetical protein